MPQRNLVRVILKFLLSYKIQDLDTFLNSSKKGAVLFSLGSTLRANDLPMEKIELFINVFREFDDYNFLWKFENNKTITNLPKNICIQSWVPQSDVLAHPKLKAFITHGGLCSFFSLFIF